MDAFDTSPQTWLCSFGHTFVPSHAHISSVFFLPVGGSTVPSSSFLRLSSPLLPASCGCVVRGHVAKSREASVSRRAASTTFSLLSIMAACFGGSLFCLFQTRHSQLCVGPVRVMFAPCCFALLIMPGENLKNRMQKVMAVVSNFVHFFNSRKRKLVEEVH